MGTTSTVVTSGQSLPDLHGLAATTAIEQLRRLGARASVPSGDLSACTVAQQNPLPGARIASGATVTLTLNCHKRTGSCGTVAARGTRLEIAVKTGSVDCRTALSVMMRYFTDSETKGQGSGGFVQEGEWGCISSSAAQEEETGLVTECSDDNRSRVFVASVR
jgi:hypothetical protein